jgi:ribosomal protein L19
MGAQHYRGMIVWTASNGKTQMYAIEQVNPEKLVEALMGLCSPDQITSLEIKKVGA